MPKYVYPVVITNLDLLYSIRFPNFPSEEFELVETLYKAIALAEDKLAAILCELEDEGAKIPEATDIRAINLSEDKTVTLITCDTIAYRAKFDDTPVVKKLIIPSWMDTAATKANIDLSKLLENALEERLLCGGEEVLLYHSSRQDQLNGILENTAILSVTIDNAACVAVLGCQCDMKTEKDKFETAAINALKSLNESGCNTRVELVEFIAAHIEDELDREVFVINSDYNAALNALGSSPEQREGNLPATLLS